MLNNLHNCFIQGKKKKKKSRYPKRLLFTMWEVIVGSGYDIPVMHNSLSTQFAAKIIKCLFPENFPW